MPLRRPTLMLAVLLSLALFARADEPAPRLDFFGDPLPARAVSRLGTMRWRHEEPVAFLAYSPDGKQIVSATVSGMVRVWEAATGKLIRSFDHHHLSSSNGVALSPDGKTLALQEKGGTHWLSDVSTGRWTMTFKLNRPWANTLLVFAPDNKSLFARYSDHDIRQIDVDSGGKNRDFGTPTAAKQRVSLHPGFGSMIVSADGKTLIAGAQEPRDKKIHSFLRCWDIESSKELPPIEGPEGAYEHIAFSPDARRVAWSSTTGATRIWDIVKGEEIRTSISTMNRPISAMSFSPDGRMLLIRTAADLALHMWSIAEGKERLRVEEPETTASRDPQTCNLALSPDGRFVAMGTRINTIRVIDLGTGADLTADLAGHYGAVQVALSADGKRVATLDGNKAIQRWDNLTGKARGHRLLPLDTLAGAFSADGTRLVAGSNLGTAALWDTVAGKEIKQWQPSDERLLCLAISPDGTVVATRDFEQSIRLWDAATGRQLQQIADKAERPDSSSAILAFSSNGSRLASAVKVAERGNGNVVQFRTVLRLWDVATGKLLRTFDVPPNITVTLFAFSPDGRTLATVVDGGSLLLWECASGKERAGLALDPNAVPPKVKPVPFGARIFALAYSPDGKRLAVGDGNGLVQLCDAATGKELTVYQGHAARVGSLAFAANGRYLASGALDGSALVWEVPALEKPPALELDAREVELVWDELTNPNAVRGYSAVRVLSQMPDQVMPLLRKHLQPVPVVEAGKLTQLIADLDSNVFAARRKAEDELGKLGEAAEEAISKALKGKPALEMQKRLEGLLPRVAIDSAPTADQLRTLRGLEVLESIGTPEAREVVERLAAGAAGTRITRDAQGALERMKKR